jgi:DNA-binding NarL/FixJ family response regulator
MLINTHGLRVEDVELLRMLPAMQREGRSVRVAVLSDLESRENVIAALRHGVSGYLLTSLPLKVAAEVIRVVHAGGTFVPSSVVLDPASPGLTGSDTRSAGPEMCGFTPRQVEVLRRLGEGKQNKAIAFELNMSESTVKVHLHHIMQKLKATNRMQVVMRTRQLFEPHRPEPGGDAANGLSGAFTEAVSVLCPMNLVACADPTSAGSGGSNG